MRRMISVVLFTLLSNLAFSQGTCDDFTMAPWPSGVEGYSEGDTVGYSQGGTETIIVGQDGFCDFSTSDVFPGMYIFNTVNFSFDGDDQNARFNIYGITSQYSQMGFSVNGSATHYMNEPFPLVIDGIIVDIDNSAVDIFDWDNAYLMFSGKIDEIDIIGFESGIIELCVESNEFGAEECDDLTNIINYPSGMYMSGDTIGYTQGGEETMISGAGQNDFIAVNFSDPGIYGAGTAEFSFDGSNQNARFTMYGFLTQFDEMGFSVNGSPLVFLDSNFPITVNGIMVDIDLSPPNEDSWEYFYLTFTGELDIVTQLYFESGTTELCVESNETVSNIEIANIAKLSIYPNPAQSKVNIESSKFIESIHIYSLQGKLVLAKESLKLTHLDLEVSQLNTGFYFVKTLLNDGEEQVQKLIIE